MALGSSYVFLCSIVGNDIVENTTTITKTNSRKRLLSIPEYDYDTELIENELSSQIATIDQNEKKESSIQKSRPGRVFEKENNAPKRFRFKSTKENLHVNSKEKDTQISNVIGKQKNGNELNQFKSASKAQNVTMDQIETIDIENSPSRREVIKENSGQKDSC